MLKINLTGGVIKLLALMPEQIFNNSFNFPHYFYAEQFSGRPAWKSFLRQQIEKIVILTNDEFRFVMTRFTARSFKKHPYVVQPPKDTEHCTT